MKLEIKEIKDKDIWENFFLEIEKKTFLNSWTWTLFRESMGNKIYRKGIWENKELIAVFFISKIKAKKANFLLLTHSPSIKKKSDGLVKKIIDEVKKTAKEDKIDYIRIAPIWQEDSEEDKEFKKQGFFISPSSVFPEKSWELSLNQSEDEILSKMRKGTRYIIKKGTNDDGLKVFVSKNKSDLDIFYDIYKKTASRHGFIPFSFDYIKKEFDFFSEKNETVLILCEKEKKYVAGAVIIFWQGTAFYHHGASLIFKESASHLIQWEAIKEARKRKCQKYNFWVISPSDDSNHRWSGLTFFKKGFGGYETNYAKTKDFPLSRKYWLTYLLEKIK